MISCFDDDDDDDDGATIVLNTAVWISDCNDGKNASFRRRPSFKTGKVAHEAAMYPCKAMGAAV